MAAPDPREWVPTADLRWFRPRGGGDWETHLQQRWQRGAEFDWRNVPTEFAD